MGRPPWRLVDGVRYRLVQDPLRRADAQARDCAAGRGPGRSSRCVAAAGLADQPVAGDPDLVEAHLGGPGEPRWPILWSRGPTVSPWLPAVDRERRDAAARRGVGIGPGEHDEQVGQRPRW